MSNKIAKVKAQVVSPSKFDAGYVPATFLPHATLSKHGAAYVTHGVNVLATDQTLAALRKARVMVGNCVTQLDALASKLNHAGIAGMRELARKSQNACDGLLDRVDQKQGGKLYETQLSAATGALSLAAHTIAAASALVQACEALTTGHGFGFSLPKG